ncbi:MAG: hypothetical protein GEU99_23125 [Luteitalea sp.]|nr:hypothetical protein [Luteitalea sp.]
MGRTVLRGAAAVALIGLGWAAGKAQTPQPDFELIINAPAGQTSVECLRGCELMWVERGVNPNDTPRPTFSFGCRGASVERCSSAKIGGWINP